MHTQQLEAGRGNKDAKLFDQLQRSQQQMRRPIAASRMGQLVQQLAMRALLDSRRQSLYFGYPLEQRIGDPIKVIFQP